MTKTKKDNSIFIKAKIGLIVEFIFDLPLRIFQILLFLAITSFVVVLIASVIYFILEFFINLFIDFKLEGEIQWYAIAGISSWVGAYFGLTDYKKTEKDSPLRGIVKLFDFSKYSIAYNKINSGIVNKKLPGQSEFQEIDFSLSVPEFWKSRESIKISDLKKSKDIEVLEEKPKGWLKLKYGFYNFVAKYEDEEKKLKAVQIFSRKEKSFIDSLGTNNETKSLLEYMVQKEYRILYLPMFISHKPSSVELFKKKYKKDKDYEKKKESFVTHNYNRFDRLYDHINNYFNFQIADKENQIKFTVKNKGKLVTRLKNEIQEDFESFFHYLEKVGDTKIEIHDGSPIYNFNNRVNEDIVKVVPKFWKSQKPIKISDLKKSNEMQILKEEPKGWLRLGNTTYTFVAKYGDKEKKSGTVQIFSRKSLHPIDAFGHKRENQMLLQHMVNRTLNFQKLYDDYVKLWEDKNYLKKRINKIIRDYYFRKLLSTDIFKKYNEVEVLKKEIQNEFNSFFKCLEKIGKTKVVEVKGYKP